MNGWRAAGALLGASVPLGGCQTLQGFLGPTPQIVAVGQPHAVILDQDADPAPTITVQWEIPVAATGAKSLVLQRDGQTITTISSIAQASPSPWLAGGVDLWDDAAPDEPNLTYHVVAAQGSTTVSRDVPVTLGQRVLTTHPSSLGVDDSHSRTAPVIYWTQVDAPGARLASEYRINLAYPGNFTPELSYLVGPDHNTLDLGEPASWSTGVFRVPQPLSLGSQVEIQVVAIASSSALTEETLSKAFYYTP